MQGLQTDSLDEDSTEDTPLFSPDTVDRFESQPHDCYVIQEKIEMVCISKRESACADRVRVLCKQLLMQARLK